MDELRVVARYVAESAGQVLPVFEGSHPEDLRPRAAVEAAWDFVQGARRSNLLRTASLDAHRAARQAATESARLAARSAGDAAAAAFLHPLAKATQIGHILRAAASVARIAELQAGGDPRAAAQSIESARLRADTDLAAILRRYPTLPAARTPVAQLMMQLDSLIRNGS